MRVLLEPVLVAAGVDIVLTGARARPLQEGRHPPPTVRHLLSTTCRPPAPPPHAPAAPRPCQPAPPTQPLRSRAQL